MNKKWGTGNEFSRLLITAIGAVLYLLSVNMVTVVIFVLTLLVVFLYKASQPLLLFQIIPANQIK